MDFYTALENVMHSHGFDILGSINYNSNKFQRFKRKSLPWKGRDLFVKLLGRDEGAVFGDWHDREGWVTWWEKPYKTLSKQEKKIRALQIEGFRHSEELQRNHDIFRGAELYKHHRSTEPDWDHPYIKTKQIRPLYCRQIRQRLMIPIHDINGKFQSMQFIFPSGKKRFKRGTTPREGFCILGEQVRRDVSDLWICEGWATGCTIYEAVGEIVFCSMGADNLFHIACALRLKYPNNKITLCADNDAHLKENKGLITAQKAAKASGSLLRVPDFSLCGNSTKPTDFNDLMRLVGIEEVERQLLNLR